MKWEGWKEWESNLRDRRAQGRMQHEEIEESIPEEHMGIILKLTKLYNLDN